MSMYISLFGRSRRPWGCPAPDRASARREVVRASRAACERRAGRAGDQAGENASACDTHAAIASTRRSTAPAIFSTAAFPWMSTR